MKKKVVIGLSTSAVLVLAIWFFAKGENTELGEVLVDVKKGTFTVEITTTGELEAKNSVKILGPSGLRAAQIYQVKIDHIIEEGTIVKKGGYVARLDQSDLSEKIQKQQNDLQQSLSTYTQTKLDTALELRKARDELVNLKYTVEEREITLSQSQYEPPATIKQEEINLAKAKRKYSQEKENYKLKVRRARAQMNKASSRLAEVRDKYNFLIEIKKKFNIRAPESGMLVYGREWNGTKKGIGSTIRAWAPIVATLPDLDTLISKTYINEVDIRSIKVGQLVNIGLDAFPDKKLTGRVINVANIGEQKPNSDAKVFQVNILVNGSDKNFRPSMTTSNNIIAETIEEAIFVPLECLHNQGDSVTYVIKKSGLGYIKQQVEVGEINANEVVVREGLKEGEKLYLSVPDGVDDAAISYLERGKDKSNKKKS